MFGSAEELVEAVLIAEAGGGADAGADDTTPRASAGASYGQQQQQDEDAEEERWRLGMQSDAQDQVMLQPVAPDARPSITAVTALLPPPTAASTMSMPTAAAAAAPSPSPAAVGVSGGGGGDEDARAFIMSLGFDREQAETALVAAGGNAEQAVEMLLAG
jgi:hypothetical protein